MALKTYLKKKRRRIILLKCEAPVKLNITDSSRPNRYVIVFQRKNKCEKCEMGFRLEGFRGKELDMGIILYGWF